MCGSRKPQLSQLRRYDPTGQTSCLSSYLDTAPKGSAMQLLAAIGLLSALTWEAIATSIDGLNHRVQVPLSSEHQAPQSLAHDGIICENTIPILLDTL